MKKRRVLSFTSVAAMLLAMFLGAVVTGVSAAPVLPGGATIGEDDEKLTLMQGDIDWVIGTKSGKYEAAEGHFYTDYAQAWAQNSQDGGSHDSNVTPEKYIYALNLDTGARAGDYYFGGFMGYPVYDLYRSEAPWTHGGILYKVQGNSYVAMALALPKASASLEKAEEFLFESSVDNGATWAKLDTVGDITLDYDANDPTVTGDKSPSVSIYKAVVKLPGSSEDTVKLRITIPGGKDDGQGYVFPGLGYGNADHRIGTVVVSAHDLSQYKTIDQVPEFKTPVLTPGIYDDLEDDFYYDFHIRSTWNNTPDYNWNTAEGYAKTFVPQTSDGWEGWTALIGRFMGQVIPKAYKTEAAWNGSAMVYEVEAGSYVATAIPTDPDAPKKDGEVDFSRFGFDVSADKDTWTAVTPTIVLDSARAPEGNVSYFDVYKAVVQIPEGMKYYRITLPGFDPQAQTSNDLVWSPDRDTAYDGKFYIGPSFASAYDLTDYTDLTKVPDSPLFVDIKGELRNAIILADALNLKLYEEDDAMEAFLAKLEEAKAYLNDDPEHTHDEYKAKAAELDKARAALTQKDVPGAANVGQNDTRRILKPGVADWIEGSAFTDGLGAAVTGTDGVHTWYACYTDYAKSALLSTQDGVNLTADGRLHATAYDHYLYATFQSLEFMGKPLEGVFVNCASWACGVIEYRVYAGSYVSTAIVVATNAQRADQFPDIQEDYVFQVSADGQTWQAVAPSSLELADTAGDEEEIELYKAVTQIPAGMSYYRIVMPGAASISPDTTYTPDCPSYEHTYVGPTIASMSDLSAIDTYAEVPDATDWYADPAVTSKDPDKVQITEDYFKARVDGMTIDQALAALDTATGTYAFYTADGAKIADGSTVLAAGMKADLVDSKGFSLSQSLGLPMLTVSTGNDLLSIGTLEDIVLEYGAEKTAEGLKLPATVPIEAGNGSFDAAIEWDVEGCAYDPAVTQEQAFTVAGTVLLPEDVTNGSGLSLAIQVNVTVEGSSAYGVRSTDESKVLVDNDEGVVYVQEGLTAAEINALLEPVGDVFIVFAGADGSDLDDLNVKAEPGMTIDVYTEVVMIMSYDIAYLGDSGIPETGGGSALPAILAAAAASACGAAVLLAKKRRA